jgi:nucleoid-associated protein EbfC
MIDMLKGLNGLGNLANMGNLMKQVQDMQTKLAEIEEDLGRQRVEGTAGGGMVHVIANGRQELLTITIDPDISRPEDRDMLQDMLVAAVNQALEASRALRAEKMSALTGGIKIPGIM